MSNASSTEAKNNPGTAPGGLLAPEAMQRVSAKQAVLETDAGAFITTADAAGVPETSADAVVITPGGQRRRSMVHLIEAGNKLDSEGMNLRQVSASGNIVAEFGGP